jgi:hypothetical protein
VLHWLANSTALSDFIVHDADQLVVLNAVLGVALLRAVLSIWQSEEGNPSEDFWQKTLSDHAFVLSQLYAYPIVVIGEKAYVGGKRLDNRHGNLADLLAKAQISGSPLIIEIKTPLTGLLGTMYRDEAYPPFYRGCRRYRAGPQVSRFPGRERAPNRSAGGRRHLGN